jgi:hypothetical protein
VAGSRSAAADASDLSEYGRRAVRGARASGDLHDSQRSRAASRLQRTVRSRLVDPPECTRRLHSLPAAAADSNSIRVDGGVSTERPQGFIGSLTVDPLDVGWLQVLQTLGELLSVWLRATSGPVYTMNMAFGLLLIGSPVHWLWLLADVLRLFYSTVYLLFFGFLRHFRISRVRSVLCVAVHRTQPYQSTIRV